ncbi:T9SS type A sorting domain-containing protein [Flavobacterium sp. 3HN19-14]|uniref:T9SS type A sorting domain-containing protein n=1 Tax=Flavobacterium sp. 3HN19-14 TaxID=3448133 RepID=UPI003EDECA84
MISYSLLGIGGEPNYVTTTVVTISAPIQLQPIPDVAACNFYILPELSEGYYSGHNSGDVITTSQLVQVQAPAAGACPSDSTSFYVGINSVDISLSFDGAGYHANQSDATYQWVICSDPAIVIQGETNQIFVPTENGDYSVLISYGDCQSYAQCFAVDYLNTNDHTIAGLEFGPNPFHDTVRIKSNEVLDGILIYNTLGQLVFSQKQALENAQLNLSNLPNGSYFVKATAGNKTQTFKMMKN